MDTQQLVAIAVAAIGSPLLLEVTKRLISWAKGRERAKRAEIDRAHDLIDRERSGHDRTRRKLRIMEQYASRLLRRLTEAPCIDDATIPTWPDYESRLKE